MIYLDNAATTPIDPEVFQEMIPFMENIFGNPSSIHTHGRAAKTAIEKARKTIAGLLNAAPSEIFFTSGGTEADNTAIKSSVHSLELNHVITTSIEHHAVLHAIEELQAKGTIKVSLLTLSEKGEIELDELESLLKSNPRTLVSLMHANNELGNLQDIHQIGLLCKQYNAVFHSDTVQTMGHYPHNTQELNADFLVGSAHKFHGPKGVGFLYINGRVKINPLIIGGAQERNMRGGTENVYGIIGLSKALEIAYRNMDTHQKYIQGLKNYMISKLQESIQDVRFNGITDPSKSLYTVLNVSLPECDENDMLLFNLDIHKISASGGSACSSGTDIGSHVLKALKVNPRRGNVRFSFSKFNTEQEIDAVIKVLKEIYA